MNPPDRFVVRSHLKDHPSNHPQIYPSSFCHFVWTIRLSCYVRFYFGVGPVVSTSSYRKSKWNALRSSGFFSKIWNQDLIHRCVICQSTFYPLFWLDSSDLNLIEQLSTRYLGICEYGGYNPKQLTQYVSLNLAPAPRGRSRHRQTRSSKQRSINQSFSSDNMRLTNTTWELEFSLQFFLVPGHTMRLERLR